MTDRPRILVVDDDPLFRSLIVSLVRKDCIVSVASDGADGFYKALEHPPDIAVVDVQMPGWDGLKTLKAFRGHPALAHVQVMMLTGDASKETVLAAIHGGASDYLIKTSFSKEEFLTKLQKLVARLQSVALASAANGKSAAAVAPGDGDGRLKNMIDDWE